MENNMEVNIVKKKLKRNTVLSEFVNDVMRQIRGYEVQLSNYILYILNCLYRMGVPYKVDDIIWIVCEPETGLVTQQAVVYPRESVVDGEGVVNPIFFYGYRITHTDNNLLVEMTDNYRIFNVW